jgi:hypothetical protein
VQQQRIPPELLNPNATPDELERETTAIQEELRRALPDADRDALVRFEAVFGPLPQHLLPQQQLQLYEEMLHVHIREIGNDTNALSLFLQTLLPWNDLRGMTLRRLLARHGLSDPALQLHEEQRQRSAQYFAQLDADEEDH